MDQPRPYAEWRPDPTRRWRDAFHTFGHLLMAHARDDALEQIPAKVSDETRTIAMKAAVDALYNVMMILEGVVSAQGDESHKIDFALIARVRKREEPYDVIEEFELAPEGEEPVCMGFHFWTDGNFRV
jgi:hypothetical protein